MSYTVTKLHLDELLHECNGCLLLRAYTTLHHPQVGVPEREREREIISMHTECDGRET